MTESNGVELFYSVLTWLGSPGSAGEEVGGGFSGQGSHTAKLLQH